jgi:hypothetical protein
MSGYLAGTWKAARDNCERAERILRDRCVGVAWELHTVQMYGLLSIANLGLVGELMKRVPLRLREADERGDLTTLTGLRTLANLAWLAADDLDGARRELELAEKMAPRGGYFQTHNWILLGHTHADLYAGEPAAAYRRIVEKWPLEKKSLLMRIQMVRIQVTWARGRAALATAATLPAGNAQRAPLLEQALQDARAIEREGLAFAVPCARMLAAGVAAQSGDAARARALCDEAALLFELADMAMHVQVARRCLGISGGDRKLVDDADTWMTAEGIVRPERVAAMIAPGF